MSTTTERPASVLRSTDPYHPDTTGENFDVNGWLAQFDPALLTNSDGRQLLTRLDPLLFAYVYLRKHLKDPLGRITFADAHFLWIRLARRWIGPSRGPKQDRRALVAPRSCGKAVTLDTAIPTPDGWTTMRDIAVGDQLFDESGQICRVTAKSPIWTDSTYRVHFSDGTSVDAHANHEWTVVDNRTKERYNGPRQGRRGPRGSTPQDWREHWHQHSTVTTRFIAENLRYTARGDYRWRVPTARPLDLPAADLPIDPYVLGFWLGDGTAANGTINVNRADYEEIAERFGPHTQQPGADRPGCLRINITGLIGRLRDLGVLGNKHIPMTYLRASVEQRRELIRGIMDSDGHRAEGRSDTVSLNDKKLADDVLELLRTMGLPAKMSENPSTLYGRVTGTRHRIYVTFDFRPYHLSRYAWNPSGAKNGARVTARTIIAVDEIEPRETQCITVDSPTHLYLVGEAMIPTHNSTWWFLILPMWAAAHGHIRFAAAFADSGSQAELHLATFKRELSDNSLLRTDFPDLCEPKRRHNGKTINDSQNMLYTRSGFAFAARGIDSTSLGMKVDEVRPDLLICHEAGTPMLFGDRWIPVEEHPSFAGFREGESRIVDVWGLPFPEVVTLEHRYWAKWVNGRRAKSRCATWVEADQLDAMHFIGALIDTTEEPAPPLQLLRPHIATRNAAGHTTGTRFELEPVRPDWLDDPEFWWLVGLWWGDGHLGSLRSSGSNSTTVGITSANTQPHLQARLHAYLTAQGVAVTVTDKPGCRQLTWSWADLARWLRTWKRGNSRKEPPAWVERLPLHLQRSLVEGYVDADGYRTVDALRITSIHLPGLLALRRILARLGHAATIRKGAGPRLETFPNGWTSLGQQKYDIRWSLRQERYTHTRTHITGGILWSKVRAVQPGPVTKFAPIRTEGSQYTTAFGLSHNCDDVEPPESTYSAFQRDKRLSTIQNAILPLSELARVVIVGTVTMPGSIIHSLVRDAKGEETEEWIADERFKTYHTRPIIVRPDGTERSVWPDKWEMDYLNSIRHTRSFKLNYDNDPRGRAGEYWNEEDIRYGIPPNITKKYLFVDPPVTVKTRSDPCGLAIVGYAPGTGQRYGGSLAPGMRERMADALTPDEAATENIARLSRVVIHDAWGIRLTGTPLKLHVLRILQENPDIVAVVLENNQGKDLWLEVFSGLPVKFITYGVSESKEVRFARALDMFQKRRVTLAKPIPRLEDEMTAFPRGQHDDIVDAACAGVLRLLLPKPKVRRDQTVTPH